MPAAVAALAALGVDLAGTGRAFSGIRYVAGRRSAEADFPPAPRTGRAAHRSPRRSVAACERAGIELRWGERVAGLTADGVATAAGALTARLVVGADGLRSRVRQWRGSRAARGTCRASACVATWRSNRRPRASRSSSARVPKPT